MSTFFTASDLEIFQISGFQERMSAIRSTIRPKLEQFGQEVAPLLMTQFKAEFFPHTAKHMRRKVNPPDETWVALGPRSRGYKAYVFFSLCIGKQGVQARVVMKDESQDRILLGDNLLRNLPFFLKRSEDFKALSDYTKRDEDYHPLSLENLKSALEKSAEKLKTLKSAVFDVGYELKPTSKNLQQEFLKAVDLLYPFYVCGLQEGVRLK